MTSARLADELERVANAHSSGEIDVLARHDGFGGLKWRIIGAANGAVMTHVHNMRAVLEALSAYANGDFSLSVKRLPGKQALATERVDQLRDNLLRVTHAFDRCRGAGCPRDTR